MEGNSNDAQNNWIPLHETITNLCNRGRFLRDGQTPRKEADSHKLDESSMRCFSLEQTCKDEMHRMKSAKERTFNGLMNEDRVHEQEFSNGQAKLLINGKNALNIFFLPSNNLMDCIPTVLRHMSSFAVKHFKIRRTTSSGKSSSEPLVRARVGIRIRSLIFQPFTEKSEYRKKEVTKIYVKRAKAKI